MVAVHTVFANIPVVSASKANLLTKFVALKDLANRQGRGSLHAPLLQIISTSPGNIYEIGVVDIVGGEPVNKLYTADMTVKNFASVGFAHVKVTSVICTSFANNDVITCKARYK